MATTGTWSESPTSYSYQWAQCSPSGTDCTIVDGANGSEYRPSAGTVGSTLEVSVTAGNAEGSGSAVSSAATGVVIAQSNIYVAQSATGEANGTSCENAREAAWFNQPESWGAGSGEIGPGAMVHLCGTISTNLVAEGSGSAESPIVIYFEPGAAISMPVCPGRGEGCLDTNGESHLTIDGGTSGAIEDTANGTNLSEHVSGSYGIEAANCNGCKIENLTIRNLYVHESATDTSIDATQNQGINFSGSHLTIADNTLHDIGWALVAEWTEDDEGVSIHNNDIYRIDHGLASTAAFSGGSIGPIYVYGNDFHDYANWDTTTDSYHHDGIHCFSADAVGYTPHYNGLYIYGNRFGGETGHDMTAQVFLEGGSGEGATPCADPTSNIWLFNNVVSEGAPLYNGLFGLASGTLHVYNNTFIGSSTEEGVCFMTGGAATGEVFENNLLTSCNQLMAAESADFAAGGLNYNLYANGGGNAFVCNRNFYSFAEFGAWTSCMSGDGESLVAPDAMINEAGVPQAGSAALGGGVNLSAECVGPLVALCANIEGQPRPSSGHWNIGAY